MCSLPGKTIGLSSAGLNPSVTTAVLTLNHTKFLDEFRDARIKTLSALNQCPKDRLTRRQCRIQHRPVCPPCQGKGDYLAAKNIIRLQIAEPSGVGFSLASSDGSNSKDRAVEFRLNLTTPVSKANWHDRVLISWVQARPNPFTSGTLSPSDAEFGFKPEWMPKTRLGLAVTKNIPPSTSPDFRKTQATRQFRG